jgi:hypothetical protein
LNQPFHMLTRELGFIFSIHKAYLCIVHSFSYVYKDITMLHPILLAHTMIGASTKAIEWTSSHLRWHELKFLVVCFKIIEFSSYGLGFELGSYFFSWITFLISLRWRKCLDKLDDNQSSRLYTIPKQSTNCVITIF